MAFSAQIFGPNTGISIANRKQAASMGVKAANQGRGGDKYSIQATPFTANLLKNMGGATSFNPETGEMEFLFGYDSIGDMFDGGGPGASSPDQNNKSYDDDNISGNEVKGIAAASNRAAGNAASNAATGNSNDGRVVNVPEVPQDMGASWKPDWMDGGGKGKSGSTFSTEGYFTPTNNYVDPYGDESETGGVNNDGMGGADGQGNAGNFITNISNTLGGNWRDGADLTDGGGTGKSGDYYIGGGTIGAIGNMMGGPKGADDKGNVATSDGADPTLIQGAVAGTQGQQYGLEMRNGRVVYASTGANYQGGLDVNGERQEFLDGQAVTAAQKSASMGGSDDGGASRETFGSYVGGVSAGAGGAGTTYSPTPVLGGNYTSGDAGALDQINAEIVSLEQQIEEISASGSGQDTSTLEAELASLRNQLASYGLSSQEVSDYIANLDPNSPDYNPEAYKAAFGFALNPTYEGGVVDPSDPSAGGGGYVRRAVKDRETGEVRYVNVPINVDSGMDQFRDERRNGFGNAINAAMYV
jgi:hypothetical protein